MSSTYTENPTRSATITIPDDGDLENAISVNAAFQALKDDVGYVKQRLDAGTAENTVIGASSVDTLLVHATSTFAGPVSCSQLATFNNNVQCNAPVTVSATLSVSGLFTASGSATLGDDTHSVSIAAHSCSLGRASPTAGSTASITGKAISIGADATNAIDVPGAPTFHTILAFAAGGRVSYRFRVMPTGNTSGGPGVGAASNENVVWVTPSGGLGGADRTYTIDDTGAADGDWMWFSNVSDSAHNLIVKDPASATLATLNGAGNNTGTTLVTNGVFVMRMGGSWFAVQYFRNFG